MFSFIKTSLSFLFIVAGLNLSAQKNNSTIIVGSGNIITRTINTKAYDVINVTGSMEVSLQNGNEGTITVTAEDNVQDRIDIESDGNTLTISMKNNTSLQNAKKIKISIPVEAISKIYLRGSGSVEGNDILISNSMSLNSRGSGEIKVSIKADSLNVQVNGSGEIGVSGTAKNLTAIISGSGEFKGKELIAEQAEIHISGSGNSFIFVNNSLTGKINGSGNILYGGNPATNNIKVFGSGKVKSL